MNTLLRWLSALLVLVGFTAFVTGTTSADPPGQQGWWTVANPGPAPGGLPTLSSPVAPDVPAKGLLVQGGTNTPNAYAALIYQLPPAATAGDLTLNTAANTITTSGSTVQICPLINPVIHAEQGGPMADAPQYDCAKKTTAPSKGTSYQFNVSSLVSNGTLAVAILPTKVTDRVVLARPDANSLAVQAGTPAAGSSEGAGGAQTATAPATTSPGAAALGASNQSTATTPSLAALGGAPASASSPALATRPQSNGSTAAPGGFLPAQSSKSGAANPLAVGAVLAGLLLAGGLWLSAGRAAERAVTTLADAGD
jgi:hypothetical protein